MRIFICGVDGYLGWTLAQYLAHCGHEVGGFDNYFRRDWVAEVGSQSATPICTMTERMEAFRTHYHQNLLFRRGDIRNYNFVLNTFRTFQPDAVVHLAEMPSAPYSMIDVEHCVFTQTNNIMGTLNILYAMKETCPEAHLLKLGTMGEYGTPNIDIPEGFFEIEFRGRKERLPFPRQAGSWYHQTKVHDSHNIMFACKIWGLRSTDIMQGVVFGSRTPEMSDDERLCTRFDFDQCFGTCINRYCAEAIVGMPLTPYGKGGQKRGFIPLQESMRCMTLALENPPQPGEYRVFNQFAETYTIYELAEKVQKVGNSLGLAVSIQPLENPRMEMEEHYYNPDHNKLAELGYQPQQDIESEIATILQDLMKYRSRIEARQETLQPSIRWDGTLRPSKTIEHI